MAGREPKEGDGSGDILAAPLESMFASMGSGPGPARGAPKQAQASASRRVDTTPRRSEAASSSSLISERAMAGREPKDGCGSGNILDTQMANMFASMGSEPGAAGRASQQAKASASRRLDVTPPRSEAASSSSSFISDRVLAAREPKASACRRLDVTPPRKSEAASSSSSSFISDRVLAARGPKADSKPGAAARASDDLLNASLSGLLSTVAEGLGSGRK
mmetsp:Transcript_26787/g.75723  ORF Transcript_26787/g.75723 Transcript_26787/m.75723 type:complete len:220 (-) Transcript_26787:347-1006(-)